jgi:hypothetical protein
MQLGSLRTEPLVDNFSWDQLTLISRNDCDVYLLQSQSLLTIMFEKVTATTLYAL